MKTTGTVSKWNDSANSVWRKNKESHVLQKQRQLEVRRVLEKLQKQKTKQIISEMFQR
jgi:hypothetical protein